MICRTAVTPIRSVSADGVSGTVRLRVRGAVYRRRLHFVRLFRCSVLGTDWLAERPGSGQARVRTNQSTWRDRLRGWAYRIRTLMCKEKIHLFEKSREFGFRRPGGDDCGPKG